MKENFSDIQDKDAANLDPDPTDQSVIRRMANRIYTHFTDTKALVHVLVCIFAIASWANLNGMWSELPLLVLQAPETWDLPSYITLISQMANIGPLIFVLVNTFYPRFKGKIETYTSGAVIILSVVSSLLLAFFWDKTSYISGEKHSTALLSLNFFLAVGDCTSSVAFYAFMSMMKPQYIATLFIGEGLSGMLPAVIALGQGAGDINCTNITHFENETLPNGTVVNTTGWSMQPFFESPRFSVQVYFILLSCILVCCFIAFLLLNVLPYCQTEMVSASSDVLKPIISSQDQGNSYGSSYDIEASAENGRMANETPQTQQSRLESPHSRVDFPLSRRLGLDIWMDFTFLSFMAIVVVINMTLTSFLSTIQIYSTLPYGLQIYHLATTLTQIANPVACIFALLFMTERLPVISVITVVGQIGVAYIISMAALSPEPPLHDQTSGGRVSITVWIFTTLLLVYAKVCVAGAMRSCGRLHLIWTGICTQLGSLVGAIAGYLLVNEYKVFEDAPYC